MANYATLKAAVADVVKTNGTQAITGANLQAVLLSIINSIGANYTFVGVATPSTSVGTPDQNVFYLTGSGTFSNMGATTIIPEGAIGIFKYNGSWVKEQIDLFAGIRNEMQELANRLDTNRYGYNVTVFGLVAGVHTLATAVKNVPPAERFGGQKITFKTDAGWVTYQNTSLSIDNYEDVNNWVLDSGVNVEGDVTITNNPDYEDLTQNNQNELKFADKEYNAASFSGLGRKILRKNIVNGKNVLTQAMLADENTIYIIQYDYTLSADIVIPANCVLQFNGGSISGDYNIEFDNTTIVGAAIFNVSTFSGTIKNDILYYSWFNSPNLLKQIFDVAEGKTVILPDAANIDVDYSFTIPSNCTLEGNNCVLNILPTEDYIFEATRISNQGFSLGVTNTNIIVRNLRLNIDKDNGGCRLFSFYKIENLVVENCYCYAEPSTDKTKERYLFDIYGAAKNVILRDCVLENIAESHYGLCIEIRSIYGNVENVKVENCDIIHSGGDEAIAVFSNTHDEKNVVLDNIRLKYIGNNNYNCANLITSFSFRSDAGKLQDVFFLNFDIETDYLAGNCFFISTNPNKVDNVNIQNSKITVTNVKTDETVLHVIRGKFNVDNCYINVEEGINESYIFVECNVSNTKVIIHKGRVATGSERINNCTIDLYDTALLYGYGALKLLNNCVINSHKSANSVIGNNEIGTSTITNCVFVSDNINVLNVKGEHPDCYNNVFTKVNIYYYPTTLGIFRNNKCINCSPTSIKNEVYSEEFNREPYQHILSGSESNAPQNPIVGYKYYDTVKNLPCFWNGDKWLDASGSTLGIYSIQSAKKYYATNSFWENGTIDGTQSRISLTPINKSNKHAVLNVKTGDSFFLKAWGNQYANAVYIFTDTELNKISRAIGDIDGTITAQQDGYLIVQTYDVRMTESYIEGNIPIPCNFDNISKLLSNISGSGSNRPTLDTSDRGSVFFDTSLNKPIWWTGTAWVDATGATV